MAVRRQSDAMSASKNKVRLTPAQEALKTRVNYEICRLNDKDTCKVVATSWRNGSSGRQNPRLRA